MHHCFGQLRIDEAAAVVTLAGREIKLTPKEYRILAAIARANGASITKEELIASAWKGEARPQVLGTHVSQLRRKLALAGAVHEYIRSGRGGYRIKTPPPESSIVEVRSPG